MQRYQTLATFLILILLSVSGCQSQQRETGVEDEAESAATPAEPISAISKQREEDDKEQKAEVVKDLILNEDVQRTALFNINTLAYEIPGMDEVAVANYTYATLGDRPLTLDIYYPGENSEHEQLPAVIFGLGYRMSKEPLRNAHFYTSWGKLVAAAGMVGVVYDTEQPDRDLELVLAFIRHHAAELGIDPTRLGFWSSSANVPTVMSFLMQERRPDIQFSVYYYGLSLTPDRKFSAEFERNCESRGCLVAELADVRYVDPELPLFIVKAGRDFIPNINEALDHFVRYVEAVGAPVTVVIYEDGRHGFDTQDKSEESADIIAQTIEFMKANFGLE